MGKIIKNGVTYGGGSGETSIELTRAEYEALGDEKLTNGITYYITDGVPSNSGDVWGAIEALNESLGTQVTMTLSGTTLTITTK